MQFRYRITLEDYFEAQRLIRRIRGLHGLVWLLRLILILIGAASLFSLGYSYFRGPGELSATWQSVRPAVYLFCVALLFGWVVYPRQVKRSYRKNPMLQREISVNFDENRVRSDDGVGGASEFPWSHYDQFSEGSRVFVIRTTGNLFSIVSKGQMSTEEREALRSVLAKNLKKK